MTPDHSALIERLEAVHTLDTPRSVTTGSLINPDGPEAAAALRDLTEWRDIETAPKDGTIVHVFAPGFDWPETVQWELYEPEVAEEAGEEGYWTYAEGLMADATDSCEPETWTHWRQINLPSAPNQAKEAGE